jgi:choline-sulfatase
MTEGKPNILMIMCDQLAPQFSGAYGHPVVMTPYLDHIRDRGILFESAYTSCPLCAPARHSLMTGKYMSRIHCYDNSSPLAPDQPTLAHYLALEGYETVLSGKMHFIGPDQLHGFEKRLTTDIFPSDYTWLPKRPKEGWDQYSDVHKEPIAIDYVTAGVRQWSMQLDFDEEVHSRALEFLRSKRSQYSGSLQRELPSQDKRPFFLCVSYSHPHEPFHPTQELWDLYQGVEVDLPEIPSDLAKYEHPMDHILNMYHGTHRVDLDNPELLYALRRAYYAQVTYIDRKVGQLIQALKDCGLDENTLVLFLSDHGDMLGERRMVQKRCFYEYSSRIPWIMYYPARWKKMSRIREPVSIVDVMPTLLDFIGVNQENNLPLDGKSVIPLIDGKREKDRFIFCESHAAGVTTTCFMIRQGGYKYIHAIGFPPQLYDLNLDPGEWHNLCGQFEYQEQEQRLHDLILKHFNPDEIEREVESSIERRRVIREAMKMTGGPKWDYQPFFDATNRYWREG